MIFLPIAERELRVAGRKRSTFWVRIVAALVALVFGAGFLTIESFVSGPGAPSVGHTLFQVLTWLSLAVAWSAGLFFTSDCLSEEKRQGTLGFLFLTDLRGYDVVLGKLLATSLRVFYCLLAVFPILSITMLMGGVNAAQFWKALLALLSAMFVSVAAGLFVSSISRESQKALFWTLTLLVVLTAGGPAIDETVSQLRGRTFVPSLCLSSPVYLFMAADAWGQTRYWAALGVNQACGWAFLGLACWLLPRAWQQKAPQLSKAGSSRDYLRRYGPSERRSGRRRKLLEPNPVVWLACRERWQPLLCWAVAITMAGVIVLSIALDEQWLWTFVWTMVGGAFTLVVYLWVASTSTSFFLEAKRSGLTELLLATPLTVVQIVNGNWRGLARVFGPPLGLCLAVLLVGSYMAQQRSWGQLSAATAAPPAGPGGGAAVTVVTNGSTVTTTTTASGTRGKVSFSVANPYGEHWQALALVTAIGGTALTMANMIALVWFGMWTGLNSKSPNIAILKTLLCVQIIPWFCIMFATVMLVFFATFQRILGGSPAWSVWMMQVLPIGLLLGKDLGFVVWSRSKLHSEFRERASGTYGRK